MYKETKTFEDIQGLRCWIPDQPPVYEIQGWDKPQKEQMWERTPLPDDWGDWCEEEEAGLSTDPEYAHPKIEAFKQQEWNRRLNGHWFFNNGKATYITGFHYFYINWWEIDIGYPEYRDTDREHFYFWQYCVEDPMCYGDVEATMRRQGKSYKAGSITYNIMSRPPIKRQGGIQSKSDKDAEKFFKKCIIEPWKSLPEFFKPETSSGNDPKDRLDFKKDPVRGKLGKSKSAKYKKDEELRNFIDYMPDVDGAYDGQKLAISIDDEAGKVVKGDIRNRWDVKKKCLWVSGKIIGKEHMTTTVEEQGGIEFEDIWKGSDQLHKQPNGQTETGLYRYFLSALKGTFYDKYGMPAVEVTDPETQEYLVANYGVNARYGSKHYYELEMANLTGAKLASYKRKHPFTPEDMFAFGDDKSPFNTYILSNRLKELQYSEPCRRGNLVWTNGVPDTDVTFVTDPNGKWKIADFLHPERLNNVKQAGLRINAKGETIQTYSPGNDAFFRAGQDPVDAGKETQGNGSNTAMYVRSMPDISIDGIESKLFTIADCDGFEYKIGLPNRRTGIPIVQYLAREDDPLTSYEDTILTIRYFGCSILIESNKKSAINYLKDRGYEPFLMYRPSETFTVNSQSQNTIGVFQSNPIIDQWTTMLKSDITRYGHLYPFLELVKDLLEYRRKNITIHDPTVALGHSTLATLGEAVIETSELDFGSIIPTYINGVRV